MPLPHAPRNEPVNRRVGRWFNERPVLQIALCIGACAVPVYYFGPVTAVLLSPVLGALIARPLMNLAANLRYRMREHQLRDSQGRHYSYKGQAVHVAQDERGERWVLLSDVRKIIGPMASERALQQTCPGRLQPMDRKGRLHMRADALATYLGKSNDLLVLRFRTWVERTLAVPGRHARPTLGDPAAGVPPEFSDDDPSPP